MVKRKMFSKILSTALAVTMIVALSSGTTVMAAESNEIKYQKPVEISDEELGVENIDEIQQNIMQRECSEKTYAYSGISVCSESKATVSNTDPNNAYLVTNDTVTQGQVEVANEMRWYAFQIAEKSKISILLQMVETMDADLYMFALNTETSELELIGGSATEGMGTSEYFNAVLDAGIYFFAVSGYDSFGNFAFAYYQSTLDVANEVNDTVANATLVGLNNPMSGIIDSPYDFDYYKFTVTNPTILRYTITSSGDYTLGYVGTDGSTPNIIDGTMIKVQPGTYYFAVYSPNGTYSSTSTYTVNFKKIGEYADESVAPFRAIDETAGIVFQTNFSGTNCYVNGHPIDISYNYSYSASNTGGSQSYNITLQNMDGVYCQIWNEEMQGPDVVYYHSSTRPAKAVGSKYLLRLMFYADSDVKFYRIMCRGTGAYSENTLFTDPNYVIVLIDPDDGKLVDISEYNYFYQHAMGSNSITTSGRHDMTFNYNLYDYYQ